ncbi:hypothetical protein K502DRAFT_358546 [Neoconidiobolus thromboides FSU 785]|nr:hypothetical protein K502DRAFT_358546 [Neoconidiobolus thromboides FSU 785]
MWSKAKSVGGYNGKGYEISLKGNVGGGAKGMIQGWLGSEAHRAVILSTGIWQSMKWSAVGGGQKGDFATMWFGSEADEGGDNNPQQPQSQSQPEQTPQGQPQGQSQPEQIPPQQSQGQSQPQQVPPQQPQGQLQPEKIPHGQPQPEQIPQQQPQGQSRPSPITPPGNDFGSFKPIFDSISNNMGRPSVPNFRPNSPNFGQSGQRNIPDMNQFFNSPSFNKFQQGGTNIPNQISPSFNGNGQGFNNLQQSSFFSP